MSLNTAVSGIKAAQAGLDVTSNDLANTNTTGFKSGTQRFADIYPATSNSPGLGVRTNGIERSYSQGNIETTSNPLDLAVQGNGFFAVNQDGVQQYTRDGHFHLDPSTNQIVNANGDQVLGFPGTNNSGQVGPLTVSRAAQPATPSANIKLGLDLNQNDTAINASSTPFSSSDSSTYNESTSVTAYDSLGNANQINLYFRKDAGTGTGSSPDTWSVFAAPANSSASITSSGGSSLTTLQFNPSGQLSSGSTGSLAVNWNNGANNSNINFNFSGTTLGAQAFVVNQTTNDGYPPGQFQGLKVSKSGQVQSQYSNGNTGVVGNIALATFVNRQGLDPVSNNAFQATQVSGQAAINAPGTGGAGQIMGGQLEQSNVDLSSKLVNLITAQQAYQANTKSISTDKQDTQRLLQI